MAKKQINNHPILEGLVIKNTGSHYVVKNEAGVLFNCKIKGTFRLKDIRTTNPIAVGDRVSFDTNAEGQSLITAIADRRNYIIRRASNLSKQSHVIASNLDLALLVVTVNYPPLSTVFIDRFLATSEAYRIPAALAFNKIDKYNAKEIRQMEELIAMYKTINYDCFRVSATEGAGVDELQAALAGRVTLVSGHSGVGKSTLINVLAPQSNAKTGEISYYHNRGMHTTTFSEMFALPTGGYLIDTPGIKGFGTIDIEEQEAGHYFPEIFRLSAQCRFANCTHTHEPACAVRKAVEQNEIHRLRFHSYLSILKDSEAEKYR